MSADNPPAFPWANEYGHRDGMTLRDYFAGQALAGVAAVCLVNEAVEIAYRCADAMLVERAKGQKE